MQIENQPGLTRGAAHIEGSFRTVGIVFALLGFAAILAPNLATLVVEQLVAWLLVFWGLAGLLFARSFRGISEWRMVAAFFVLVLGVGLAFALLPGRGAAVITGVMVVVFLLDGALSILLGLRLSGQVPSWRWIIVSGACAFGLGILILAQWPTVSSWVLGFVTGLNFLSTGVSMLLISRASGKLTL
jgi:uncharacterized membrane protein HdeD (DUF308 family)